MSNSNQTYEYILYYHLLCPFSRQARLYLKEFHNSGLKIINEEYYLKRQEFVALNPMLSTPVLIPNANNDPSQHQPIVGIYPITEYMVDSYPKFHFMSAQKENRAAIRKYLSWFNEKFYNDVT